VKPAQNSRKHVDARLIGNYRSDRVQILHKKAGRVIKKWPVSNCAYSTDPYFHRAHCFYMKIHVMWRDLIWRLSLSRPKATEALYSLAACLPDCLRSVP